MRQAQFIQLSLGSLCLGVAGHVAAQAPSQPAATLDLGEAQQRSVQEREKLQAITGQLRGDAFDAEVQRQKAVAGTVVSKDAQQRSAAESQRLQAIGSLLHGEAFDGEVQRQRGLAGSVLSNVSNTPASPVTGATPDDSYRAKGYAAGGAKSGPVANATSGAFAGLAPRANEFGGELRFGTHNVVTKNGEQIIFLIRSLTTTDKSKGQAALRTLSDLAAQGVPEAVHFIGFATEYGLFGARRDTARAQRFYLWAAAANYQPALYNVAVTAAYGRAGAANLNSAAKALDRAAALAPDFSARVCGLGSFVNCRRGAQGAALAFAKGCISPLANLAEARADLGVPAPQRIVDLRESIATGADDGYSLLRVATYRNAAADPQYLYCKYTLVERALKAQTGKTQGATTDVPGPSTGAAAGGASSPAALRAAAARCYDTFSASKADRTTVQALRGQIVGGITAFVPIELDQLQQMRKSNNFHYGWSVPYLPLMQQDVDLFAPLMPH